jgi:NDP-sugar pyrophosphorylase family protein
VRAIILAAGKGERLKGVVDTIPKPMVRIAGKPILQHTIEWLKRNDAQEIYINLHHLPQVITDYFGNGAAFGVKIGYSLESELLGTAGAVRRIADEFWQPGKDETFLVIYGDNLVNYGLERIVSFHRTHDAMATIALYRKDDVGQSGIAVLDNDGRVLNFIEKPGPGEELSNLVNTGIYILETRILKYIPSQRPLDFGRDVFPGMISCGEALYGIEVQGELTAVDTPELLRAAILP